VVRTPGTGCYGSNPGDDNPGSGVYVGETAAGVKVAVLNLEGCVFMKPWDLSGAR